MESHSPVPCSCVRYIYRFPLSGVHVEFVPHPNSQSNLQTLCCPNTVIKTKCLDCTGMLPAEECCVRWLASNPALSCSWVLGDVLDWWSVSSTNSPSVILIPTTPPFLNVEPAFACYHGVSGPISSRPHVGELA